MTYPNSIIIAKDVQLTPKLTAKEIYISSDGEILISTDKPGPYTPYPKLTAEYLEHLCTKFYYGGKHRKHAIADILLLNRLISSKDYGDFYDNLNYNAENQNITIIASVFFR